MPKKRVPAYCHHKPTGQAFVRLDGKFHYLGAYDSPDSREGYDRLVSKWLSRTEMAPSGNRTVSEVLLHYWRYAKIRYGRNGKGKFGAAVCYRPIMRLLKHRFGKRPVSTIGPKSFRALLDDMIAKDWSRTYINDQLARGKRIFLWAKNEELIPGDVYDRIRDVEGLRKGISGARETRKVRCVPDAEVEATLPFLLPVVADMVRFQRLTVCRPSEVCILRPCDLDRSGDVWVYTPSRHKTESHDKDRRIYIGPKAQEILRPYLLRADTDYCFRPQWKGSGPCYDTITYRRSIQPSPRDYSLAVVRQVPSHVLDELLLRPPGQIMILGYAQGLTRVVEHFLIDMRARVGRIWRR